tara:strand:- start:316 stop:498 length:183 start_codon:yes stop_codon:yes gene_type:complete
MPLVQAKLACQHLKERKRHIAADAPGFPSGLSYHANYNIGSAAGLKITDNTLGISLVMGF